MEKSTADMTAFQDKERETVKAEAQKAAERLKDGKRALDNVVGCLVEKLKSARQPSMKRDVREVYFEAKPDKRDKNERIEEKTENREKISEKKERSSYFERKARRLKAYQRLIKKTASL